MILIHRTGKEKKNNLMPTTGIEPVTFALRERRSTTELNRHVDHRQRKVLSSVFMKQNSFFLSFFY